MCVCVCAGEQPKESSEPQVLTAFHAQTKRSSFGPPKPPKAGSLVLQTTTKQLPDAQEPTHTTTAAQEPTQATAAQGDVKQEQAGVQGGGGEVGGEGEEEVGPPRPPADDTAGVCMYVVCVCDRAVDASQQ